MVVPSLRKNVPFIILCITGFMIIPSLFFGAKALAIVFTLFFVSIVWNLCRLYGNNFMADTSESTWDEGLKAKQENKFFKSSV